MNLDKPSPELNLAVAEAVGIRAAIQHDVQSFSPQVFRFDNRGQIFRPSTDWNDAMEAAEKVRLFAVYLLGNRAILKRKYKGGWILETFAKAPTSLLAICAAILKIKET